MNEITIHKATELTKQIREIIELRSNKNYSIEIKRFLDYCEVNGMNPAAIRQYITELKESGKSVSWINKNISGLKNALRTLKHSGTFEIDLSRIDLDEIKPIKVNKAESAVPGDKYLTVEEIDKLVEGSTERIGLIIRFLFFTGCRISEAVEVPLSRCKRENGKTRIEVVGKRNKSRTVRIPTELYTRILVVYNGEKYLFETSQGNPLARTNVYSDILRTGKNVLGKHVTPHMFRHSRIMDLIRKNPDKLQAVSEYAGHEDPAITLRMYVHETLSDENLGI